MESQAESATESSELESKINDDNLEIEDDDGLSDIKIKDERTGYSAKKSERLSEDEIRKERYMVQSLKKGYSKPGRENDCYDTIDGSVAIFYYADEKTGEVYFALETKPDDYSLPEFGGKIALIGGTHQIGESYTETLVRELKEEDSGSYRIMLKALKENGYKFGETREYVDGLAADTYVYAARVKDRSDWETIASTELAEGHKIILSLDEIIKKSDSKFAFRHGEALKDFIRAYLQ